MDQGKTGQINKNKNKVTQLCVLGMLFQKEKLIFSLSIVLEQS